MMLQRWGAGLRRYELWIVWALGAAAFALAPVLQGQTDIIWDALNHHFYLGWVAEQSRFDRDFAAAGYQAYQYPYLYWPAYKLAMANASGVTAGVVLALLQSLAVPPVWLLARCVCPGPALEDIALRWLGVALAFSSGVTLSLLATTSNDLLAAIPLLWALAFGMMAAEAGDGITPRRRLALIALSGALGGLSVAFKLSNGPLALVLTVLWLWAPGDGFALAARRLVVGGAATLLTFAVALAPWSWQLWQHFGNPLYPFYDSFFEPLRAATGWQP
jgi:hypothetical protein